MTRWAEKPVALTVILAVLVALTQTGAITTEVIDWDESTFILLASRLLDGHLPYVDLYDNKPPMIFFLAAGVMAVFGETLWSVRLLGDASILIAALVTSAILRRITTPWPAALGGLLLVLACAIPPGQHTGTELPAIAMILGALLFLHRGRDRFWHIAGAGVLISMATLTRSNLAALAAGVGVYLTLAGLFFPGTKVARWALLPYSIAGLVPLGLFIALYWQAGALNQFFLANVTVPLSYADNQNNPLGVLLALAQDWAGMARSMPLWFGVFSGFALCGLITLLVKSRSSITQDGCLIGVFGLATGLSVLISGAAYSHYLLQLFPFAAMLAAGFLAAVWHASATRWAAIALIGLALASALRHTTPELFRLATGQVHVSESWTLRQAARQIDRVKAPEDQVWAVHNHLILWYLDIPPVTPLAAHPSNVARPSIVVPLVTAGYVRETPLQRIYDGHPAFLVTGSAATPDYLPDPAEFVAYLAQGYEVFFQAADVVVYRRADP